MVEVLFPALRDERWIGRKGMAGFSLLLTADVLLCFVLFPYRPSLFHIFLAFVAAAALFLIARRLPSPAPTPRRGPVRRPLWFALVGFFGTFTFFMSMWVLPELGVPVLFSLLAPVALMALITWGIRKMSRGGAWNDEHRGALAGGALMWFVMLAPIQELDATRTDNTTGMVVVGLATLLFLIWAWRRVRRRIRTQTVQPA
jgi:hypothetical protein